MSWIDPPLRAALTAVHRLMRLGWFVRRPHTLGAHGLPITPEGRIVLVKLRYAPGWRVPGGGRTADEDPEQAVLRELREEIGLLSHGRVRFACEIEEDVDFRSHRSALLVVDDVRYAPPRFSLEVEAVAEFHLDDLPPDVAAPSARWIGLLRSRF